MVVSNPWIRPPICWGGCHWGVPLDSQTFHAHASQMDVHTSEIDWIFMNFFHHVPFMSFFIFACVGEYFPFSSSTYCSFNYCPRVVLAAESEDHRMVRNPRVLAQLGSSFQVPHGCFLKWWYTPISTTKWSFLVGKPHGLVELLGKPTI